MLFYLHSDITSNIPFSSHINYFTSTTPINKIFDPTHMQILKRTGHLQAYSSHKITNRLLSLSNRRSSISTTLTISSQDNDDFYPLFHVDIPLIVSKVTDSICDHITTYEIDNLASEVCASMCTVHPDYGTLAGRIVVSNLHKETCFDKALFFKNNEEYVMDDINASNCVGLKNDGVKKKICIEKDNKSFDSLTMLSVVDKLVVLGRDGVINKDVVDAAVIYRDVIEKTIDYGCDYKYSFFAMKTLMKSYLIKKELIVDAKKELAVDDTKELVDDVKKELIAGDAKSKSIIMDAREELVDDAKKELIINKKEKGDGASIQNSKEMKKKLVVFERPQDMLIRVALGIYPKCIDSAMHTYTLMSQKYFTHATPTLFNAGTTRPQMSSCFLLDINEDSIPGIYSTLTECAQISKNSGGIGLSITKIRSSGSKIGPGISGHSNGIVPMLKVFDSTAKYVDQGGNKRPGSIAVFIEPWHKDIFDFLMLRKNTGKDEVRARDLFLGLWIPDLFMERVREDGDWSLFCPNDCYFLNNSGKYTIVRGCEYKNKAKGLYELYGEEFNDFYTYLELQSKIHRKTIKAQNLWRAIIETQIETGNPYILYKDSCNRKNNQKNLGTLKGSNLCTEILQFTGGPNKEVAVCNLASIALPLFVKKVESTDSQNDESNDNKENTDNNIHRNNFMKENKNFSTKILAQNCYKTYKGEVFQIDYQLLIQLSSHITKNLNNVIDKNFYPIDNARRSNVKHRPIGIGVQGLADVFFMLRIPFESEEAKLINKRIFECIYYGALKSSIELAKENGVYESYNGSPLSEGTLQFDFWVKDNNEKEKSYDTILDRKYLNLDWESIRKELKLYGARNSLLIAPMPTASTSQILGFNECIEPITSNIYSRRTLAGEFQIINKFMLEDLINLYLWNKEMKNTLVEKEGCISAINIIPKEFRDIYKSVWEMKMKNIIDMAVDRQPFIDQSQSLNMFVAEPTYQKITSMHFYGWGKGLKTGMYYLRTVPVASAIKVTVEREKILKNNSEIGEGNVCNMEDGCMSCSG